MNNTLRVAPWITIERVLTETVWNVMSNAEWIEYMDSTSKIR